MADTLTHSMHVEVISPDGPIFSEDNVDMVVARAEDGEFSDVPKWRRRMPASDTRMR